MLGSNSSRDKIFKSWTGVSEVALIKEVATKGEYIDLCIEYWARKRKMTVPEYKLFFHDVVQTYVQRLLSERLVCKAENVLRNVQRDVRCCYFQFAMECEEDEELRELVLDHVQKSSAAASGANASNMDDILQELQFNWSLLRQIQMYPSILMKCKAEMPHRRLNLETLTSLMKDTTFRRALLSELYFASGDQSLLSQLSKTSVWHFIVDTNNQVEIARWCKISSSCGSLRCEPEQQQSLAPLEHYYCLWSPLEADMLEYAVKHLKEPTELVRNYFAESGFFFPDERDCVPSVLRRICTTQSFKQNSAQLPKLALGKYILEQNNFVLMLCDFVSIRELEELAVQYTDFEKLLELVVALKANSLEEREGFENIFQAAKAYLESITDDSSLSVEQQQPLLALYDFLCHEPTVSSLNCFLLSSPLKRIPYLVNLSQRIEGSSNASNNANEQYPKARPRPQQPPVGGSLKHMPNAYELLRKFKSLDFKEFIKSLLHESHGPSASSHQHQPELASFSNERLCQRYARKYELNFLHYLKQQRSAYAVYYLLTTYLQSYAQITRAQLFSACETVTELALKHGNSPELVTHCVAFCEMLGFDTQSLRSMFKLIRLIDPSEEQGALRTEGADAQVFPVSSYGFLIKCVEDRLLKQIKSNYDGSRELLEAYQFPLADYAAIVRLANECCSKSARQEGIFPMSILEFYASENDWWRLLVIMQYFEMPLDIIAHLLDSFQARQVGEHLLRALCHDASAISLNERDLLNSCNSGRRHHTSAQSRHRKSVTTGTIGGAVALDGLTAVQSVMPPVITTSFETMGSSASCFTPLLPRSANVGKSRSGQNVPAARQRLTNSAVVSGNNDRIDIFAIVLWSSTTAKPETPFENLTRFLEIVQDNQLVNYPTSWNLMKFCIKYRMPVLALLAAAVNPANVDYCWLLWLSISLGQWPVVLQKALTIKNCSDLSWLLIQTAVQQADVSTVYRSFCVFYEKNPLGYFLKFLHQTKDLHDFSDESVHNLRLYLLACSNNEVKLPFHDQMTTVMVKAPNALAPSECFSLNRDQLMLRNVELLLMHLQNNFSSSIDQQNFLFCVCRSDIGDICGGHMDFCLLNEVFTIIQSASHSRSPSGAVMQHEPAAIRLNFERLLQRDSREYEEVLNKLKEANAYDAAINLATLLHLPICDIVFSKWVAALNDERKQCKQQDWCPVPILFLDSQSFKNKMEERELLAQYEAEIAEHALPPDVLVNFFLYAASSLDEAQALRRYNLLQHALNVIKKHHLFPSECFDRDQIEYEMLTCYLQIDEAVLSHADIYHSEYYEQIMRKERCVLYKSFLELKELAGIEDLNLGVKPPLTDSMQSRLEQLLHRLLDEGDIVEALRLQELFKCRPIDLRFIVFCMALAEGVTTIFSMSSEERQLLRDVEKSAFAKFNKRTLSTLRSSTALAGGSGAAVASGGLTNQPYSSSPIRSSFMHESDEFSDSCSTLEFEEIPSKEKRETLDTIQGIASKLKHGIDLGKRIVMAYRAAMYLDKEYLDVLRTKDVTVLLRSVAEEGCLHRLLVVSDILTSTQMTSDEVAELLGYEITTAIIRPRFYIFNANQQQAKNFFKNAELWGYNIDRDLHLFLELTPNTTKLGNALLDYCDALKAYRKYQDNKTYEHNASFEKLAEIISIYGLPNMPGANTGTSSTKMGSMGAAMAAAVSVAPVNIIGGIQVSQNGGTTPPPAQVLSHKKQNLIYVELLIKAHQCFVHECSMEGIANVLNRAKALNVVLTHAKSWSLMVRMLIGIARYREMYYCFDALIENEQFESLLGQFEEEKTVGLRQAILAYLREYDPPNSRELLKLAALHFLMYKDLAEMWEHDAQKILGKVLAFSNGGGAATASAAAGAEVRDLFKTGHTQIKHLRCNPEVLGLLQQALEDYTHATENYLLDNKLLLAQKSAAWAELVAMQMDLVSKWTMSGFPSLNAQCQCVCVLNVQSREEFRELVNAELSVPQSLILHRAYGYDANWTEALLSQYILLTRKQYLRDYLAHLSISDNVIENIIKGFQRYMQNNHKSMPQMEEHLAYLLTFVRSVTLKYKLASLLSQKSVVMTLINEQTIFYLKDTNYGRNESHNMPDI